MKILFFMESYYCGGVDTFVVNLINNWPNQNDELCLICNETHAGLEGIRRQIRRPCRIIENNIIIFTSIFNKIKVKNIADIFTQLAMKFSSPILRYLFLVYNVLALRALLFKGKFDRLMIINGGYPGGDSCRAATICWGIFGRRLSIHNYHGVVVKSRWCNFLQEHIVDFFVSQYTKTFITVSHAAKDLMQQREVINKNGDIRFIYSGIEYLENSNRAPKDIKNEMGIMPDSRLCLMLGNYNYNKNFNKGHKFLLQAFTKVVNQIPNVYLLICGHGSPEDIKDIKRMTGDFGLNNHVYLSHFRDDISSILQASDILLVSAQVFESFGFAIIEAMANQIPVVATNVGAIPEILLDGQGGYCVGKTDVDNYASHIINLLKDNKLRKSQGQKGFARYNKLFTASRMAQEYAKLICSNE